jgi:hypothetical protein
MRVPDRLTVKMTVQIFEAAASALRINSLEGPLMIEWGRFSIDRHLEVYRKG